MERIGGQGMGEGEGMMEGSHRCPEVAGAQGRAVKLPAGGHEAGSAADKPTGSLQEDFKCG